MATMTTIAAMTMTKRTTLKMVMSLAYHQRSANTARRWLTRQRTSLAVAKSVWISNIHIYPEHLEEKMALILQIHLLKDISGIINLRTLVVWSRRPLVLLSCRLVVELPVVALPFRPLVTPPSCLLALPLIILSLHCPLIFSLRRLVVVASPLVAPPSCPLVAPHSCPLVVLSLRCPLAI